MFSYWGTVGKDVTLVWVLMFFHYNSTWVWKKTSKNVIFFRSIGTRHLLNKKDHEDTPFFLIHFLLILTALLDGTVPGHLTKRHHWNLRSIPQSCEPLLRHHMNGYEWVWSSNVLIPKHIISALHCCKQNVTKSGRALCLNCAQEQDAVCQISQPRIILNTVIILGCVW